MSYLKMYEGGASIGLRDTAMSEPMPKSPGTKPSPLTGCGCPDGLKNVSITTGGYQISSTTSSCSNRLNVPAVRFMYRMRPSNARPIVGDPVAGKKGGIGYVRVTSPVVESIRRISVPAESAANKSARHGERCPAPALGRRKGIDWSEPLAFSQVVNS